MYGLQPVQEQHGDELLPRTSMGSQASGQGTPSSERSKGSSAARFAQPEHQIVERIHVNGKLNGESMN